MNLREGLPPLPATMRRLPVDHRGYPVPWFVAWIDGKPDFRVVDSAKFRPAIKQRLCWLCGSPLGAHFAFVIGPMCGITRTISEPPSHVDCAMFSAQACPFLALPKAKRRESNMPDGVKDAPGVGLKRNPGAVAVWVTDSYRPFKAPNGQLFEIGKPKKVHWYAEGRSASRSEVLASVESGIPLLGIPSYERAEFDARFEKFLKLLPSQQAAA